MHKVTVVGAGSVGAAVAFAAVVRGVAEKVALYDVDGPRAEAEALDLRHGLQFAPTGDVFGGADPTLLRHSDVVVLAAGAKQRPGQSRLDLAAANARMTRAVMPVIAQHAPEAIVLVVTNPCDVITYVAQEIADDPMRIFGTGTVLDTARLRVLLADRLGVAVGNIHATIVGEHGDSEFALWSSATAGGAPMLGWRTSNSTVLDVSDLEAMADEVRGAAYRIIAGKGATSSAIGLATARILAAISDDEHAVLPVSTRHHIEGVGTVCLSLPMIVGRYGVLGSVDISLDETERAALRHSAAAIRATLDSL
jgi:L-lactate dehydrogenase